MNKILIFFGIIIIVMVLTFPFLFKREYIYLLKKDAVIKSYNSSGQLDGTTTIYKNGIPTNETNYKNGKREGWGCEYYANGQINNKRYYHLDEPDGPEYQYYKNGELNYKSIIQNNRRVGYFYWYTINGKLDFYSTYDIDEQPFCTFDYSTSGKILHMTGPPISPLVFSMDTQTDSIVILNQKEKVQNIEDLFIVVATPPETATIVNVKINGIQLSNLKIVNNIMKISNAFHDKKLYTISIRSKILDKNGKSLNGINGEVKIIKQ